MSELRGARRPRNQAPGPQLLAEHGWIPASPGSGIAADAVDVWWIDLQWAERHLPVADVLSQQELQRRDRFVFEYLRRRWAASRAALRCVLGACVARPPSSLRFETSEHGKPSLVGDDTLQFNLSHSEDVAVVAVSGSLVVGADVEAGPGPENVVRLAQSVFSDPEQAELVAQPETARGSAFLRGWTRKEAFVKAVGQGLSYPLARFTVSLTELEGPCLRSIDNATGPVARTSIQDLAAPPGWFAALATFGTPARITRRQLSQIDQG